MAQEALAGMATDRALTQQSGRRLGAAVLLILMMGAVYRSVLPAWFGDLWVDPSYSHGLLVPLVSAWLAYERRDQLAALTPRPARSGLILVLGAMSLLTFGLLAAELFTMRLSLLLLITGLLAFILGYQYVRALALPVAFLLFMVPLPTVVFNAIAFPLQLVASSLAISVLQGLGVPALREGNVILLPHLSLEVVEACSGLRSLTSLAAVSAVTAVVLLRRTLPRLVMMASIVPIAVLSNGLRVSGTAILAYRFGQEVSEGFFHIFSGWLVFVVALLLLAVEAVGLRRFEGG
jgi:exosortase